MTSKKTKGFKQNFVENTVKKGIYWFHVANVIIIWLWMKVLYTAKEIPDCHWKLLYLLLICIIIWIQSLEWTLITYFEWRRTNAKDK